MEAKAIAKGVRISPRKCKLTIDLIRNKSVIDALNILSNLNNEGARLTTKVLNSAIANAVNNLGLDKNKLYVKEIYANQGQVMKRMRIGSRTNVSPRLKKTSHITVIVSEQV